MATPAQIEAWMAALVRGGVAGPHRSHSHHNNLGKLRRTLQGDPSCTFGLSGLDEIAYEEALAVMGAVAGWDSQQPTEYVDPRRTIDAALEAGRVCRKVSERGGVALVATGHPDTLIPFLSGVAGLLEGNGMRLRDDLARTVVNAGYRGRTIEYERKVAVLSDEWGPVHTHAPEGMEAFLASGTQPDLVVADHGWAGAAMEEGILTVATLDTNDPALALGVAQGRPGVLIPLDDGRPPSMYQPVFEAFRAGFEEAEKAEEA